MIRGTQTLRQESAHVSLLLFYFIFQNMESKLKISLYGRAIMIKNAFIRDIVVLLICTSTCPLGINYNS
jgi:hypothetical protein